MTAFLTLAATVTLLAAAGVAFALRRGARSPGPAVDEVNAAVYREQIAEIDAALREGSLCAQSHARSRDAIRARLARELAAPAATQPAVSKRWMPAASVIFVCVSAPALYVLLGNPGAMRPAMPTGPAVSPGQGHALQGEPMAARVQRLARRLERDPEDLDGWLMLARSQASMGRFEAAAAAFGEASRRAPRDANILADRADVLAMAAGRRFEGEPDALVARALAIDPSHRKSLALAGSSAFARRDFANAVAHWKRLREQLPADSEAASRVDASIARAAAATAMVK